MTDIYKFPVLWDNALLSTTLLYYSVLAYHSHLHIPALSLGLQSLLTSIVLSFGSVWSWLTSICMWINLLLQLRRRWVVLLLWRSLEKSTVFVCIWSSLSKYRWEFSARIWWSSSYALSLKRSRICIRFASVVMTLSGIWWWGNQWWLSTRRVSLAKTGLLFI